MNHDINHIIKSNNESVKKAFKKHNLSLPAIYTFSNINIVIGSNGSGKTRLLNAIREIYNSNGINNIMYGYFPDLSPSKKSIKETNELPICTLYESLQENDIQFQDFLREIELHNEDYIPQLLSYHSQLQKQRGEKALKTLTETYKSISGNEILLRNKIVCLKDKNSVVAPLKDIIGKFSPGELIIFYMSVFISLQKNSSNKKIIILDEPECHLHPKAMLDFVKLIVQSNFFDSIWIATHSIFLVPEFDFQNIVYIDNSQILPRTSKLYQSILTDLLGDNTERTQLFLSSLSQWQYSEYIAECFTNPSVIDTVNPEDEQVQLFVSFINKHKALQVLDYGGGSARLGLSLRKANSAKTKSVDYEIFDTKPQYTGNDFTVYESLDSIKKKYDCVVLMNVLHEIDPDEWVNIFQGIEKLLNDDAYLLFVETSVLTKGEMPNSVGYLVLDVEELETLFPNNSHFPKIIIKETQKSVCVPIHKSSIGKISTTTVHNAIKRLEKTTFEQIQQLRRQQNFQSSRYYAFLTQLYINAKIYNDSKNRDHNQDHNYKHKYTPSKVNLINSVSKEPYKHYRGSRILEILGVLEIEQRKKIAKILKQHILFQDPHFQSHAPISIGIAKQLENFIVGEIIEQSILDMLLSSIVELEKPDANKDIIAIFLLSLFVMGDTRAKNRIINNGYDTIIKNYLKDLVI